MAWTPIGPSRTSTFRGPWLRPWGMPYVESMPRSSPPDASCWATLSNWLREAALGSRSTRSELTQVRSHLLLPDLSQAAHRRPNHWEPVAPDPFRLWLGTGLEAEIDHPIQAGPAGGSGRCPHRWR